MADVRISDATTATTGTVYVPGGAGGAPLKVATTAVGREVMGAASAAAARAALELDDRYARLGADNEYGGVQTVTDGVTGTVTVGPGQIVVESVGEEPSQTVITTSSVSSGQFVGSGAALTGLTTGQIAGLAAALAAVPTLAGANTFTGALTAAAGLTLSGPSGLAMRFPAPSGTAGRYFTISSAWNGAFGGDDEATFLGANYSAQSATNRGRIDPTRGAAMLGIESQYKAYTGAPYQDEYYFQTVTPDDHVYRSFMSELRYDGTAQNYLAGNLALVPVIDNDVGVGTPHWTYDANSGTFSSYGKVLVQRTNNVAWCQQWDSGGTPQSLIYLDASNVTQVGSAGGVTLAGPVATGWSLQNGSGLTLMNAVPLRANDSGGGNPISLITRNVDGTVTVGASGVSTANPGRCSFTHTPAFNTDTPLSVVTTMTGAGTNYYGSKVAVTFSGTNTGSVHYLSELSGNCTSTANSPTVTGQRVVITANGASAYLPDVTGFEYSGGTVGGYIGTQCGLKIKSPTATGGGFHSTTFYGVQVEDVTGPTNPYSIYTGAGWVRLGDGTAGSRFGAFGATPVVRPVLSYDRSDAGETAAVAAIRTALAALGWVDDQTIA